MCRLPYRDGTDGQGTSPRRPARGGPGIRIDLVRRSAGGRAGVPLLDSLTALAGAAAVTQRIRLGVSVLILPLRPVTWTAKQVATPQYLSGDCVPEVRPERRRQRGYLCSSARPRSASRAMSSTVLPACSNSVSRFISASIPAELRVTAWAASPLAFSSLAASSIFLPHSPALPLMPYSSCPTSVAE